MKKQGDYENENCDNRKRFFNLLFETELNFVSDLSVSLPMYFGLKGVKSVKQRGSYLLDGAKIHKSDSSPRKIYASFDLLNKIKQAGFQRADYIMPAASGVPFVNLGRDMFVMTQFVTGREPDMNCFADVELVLQSLADFHKAARNLQGLAPEIPCAPSLVDVFAKQITFIGSTVKQINRRPRLSDFDVLILKHANSYDDRAVRAAEILANSDYIALRENAVKRNYICHNGLKEEAFTLVDDSAYISRFEEASIDLQLCDLASVLRRYARKSSRDVPLERLISVYRDITPLPASAEKILHAMLLFPWPFLKNMLQFYSKKRNFIPAAITTRMNGILEAQEEYDEYINSIK